MHNAKWDLVVFDLAGTTVYDRDDVTSQLRETLRQRVGIETSVKEANAVMGKAKDVSLAEMLTARGKPYLPEDPFIQELLADFEERMIHHYRTNPQVRELADASTVFSELKSRGVKIGVDTGFSSRVGRAVIDRMGWEKRGLLDSWTSTDQVKTGRPAPFMIYQLMERLDVIDVARVIKIGDTPADIKMGKAARCGMTIGVLNGSHKREELEPYQPDLLLPDIGGLLELVRQ